MKYLCRAAFILMLLLVSNGSLTSPAAAAVNSWSTESTPGRKDNVLGPPGIDIRDIAAVPGDSAIYTAPGDSIAGKVIFRSADTGASWTVLPTPISADMVAVAPDNTDVIAIASANETSVCISEDGGMNWNTLATPDGDSGTARAIHDIALCADAGGQHYLATAGTEEDGNASVWYYALDTTSPDWQETRAMPGFKNSDAARTIAFSPDFATDHLLFATTLTQNESVDLQVLDLSSRQWNSRDGYPGTAVSNAGITGLVSASLAIGTAPPGSDTPAIFLGVTIAGDTAASDASGIYRQVNTEITPLLSGVNIHSIAYRGDGFIAGAFDSNTTYSSTDTGAATPTINTDPELKRPGGEQRTVVAWAGDFAVAGTSGNESAFARSANNGKSFQDISLIDTTLTNISGVAVSGDGKRVYLATDDGADFSLWQREAYWERVLSQPDIRNYLVRIAPDDPDTVYLAKRGGTTIFQSDSGGVQDWQQRECTIPIQDLAIESGNVAYALSKEGKVVKSRDGGFAWSTPVNTGLTKDRGHMITSISKDNLLVGSTDGYVAYSRNGSGTWTKIPKAIQRLAGNVQVTADSDFATNKTIYAASATPGQNIQKWVIGSSTAWTDIFNGAVSGGIYGLSMRGDTLYALEFSPSTGQSTLRQCLTPRSATATSPSWSSRTTTSSTDADDQQVQLNTSPHALEEGSAHKLWAIKTNGTNKLYSLTHVLNELALREPETNFTNPVNPFTGIGGEIVFSWEHFKDTMEYRLYLAYDEEFTQTAKTITVPDSGGAASVLVGPGQSGDARVSFNPGTRYYWRVQITEPFVSPYSPTRTFTVATLVSGVPELLVPANGASDASRTPSFSWQPLGAASEYQFVLANNASLTSPIVNVTVAQAGYAVSTELDFGKTYFWAVRAAGGSWSTTAIFTVAEKPVAPVPPVIIQQGPAPVVQAPEPPAQPPPPKTPPPIIPETLPSGTPAYFWAIIGFGALLALAAVLIVVKPSLFAAVIYGRPSRFSGEKPVSFAASAFLWMLTTDKNEGNRFMSAAEERKLGNIIVSRIRDMAASRFLYREYPEDAALLLTLWARYGSREETNQYLTKAFQEKPENVIAFLKFYFPAEAEQLSGQQYQAIARIVDPAQVVASLSRLYGDNLLHPGEESEDAAIAARFYQAHQKAQRQENQPETGGDK
ncbi:hypothetical protein ACFLWN_00950 [Chloroflexota bacterium]